MSNVIIKQSKQKKDDEYYTRYEDIEKQISLYQNELKNKIVYMNCDNPSFSNFWKYFHINFSKLQLKKIVATFLNNTSFKAEYSGGNDNNINEYNKTDLKWDGDFRSNECIEILNKCDIVITNPPFSLNREFISILNKYNKQFIIISNLTVLINLEIISLLMDNKFYIDCLCTKFIKQDKISNIGTAVWLQNIKANNKEYKKIKSYKDCDLILLKNYPAFILNNNYPFKEKYIEVDIPKNRLKEFQLQYQDLIIIKENENNITIKINPIIGLSVNYLNKHNHNLYKIIGINNSLPLHYYLGQEFMDNYKEKGHYTANMKELYYIDNNIYKVPFKKVFVQKI